jgi:hypothetical protein
MGLEYIRTHIFLLNLQVFVVGHNKHYILLDLRQTLKANSNEYSSPQPEGTVM